MPETHHTLLGRRLIAGTLSAVLVSYGIPAYALGQGGPSSRDRTISRLFSDTSQVVSSDNVSDTAAAVPAAALVWRHALGSVSHTDVVVLDDWAFVAVGEQDAGDTGQAAQLVRFRLADGVQDAAVELCGMVDDAVPLVALDGVVYVPYADGRIQAIDAATSQVLWTTGVDKPVGVPTFLDVVPLTDCAVVVEGFAKDAAEAEAAGTGIVVAYDAKTGRTALAFAIAGTSAYAGGDITWCAGHAVFADEAGCLCFVATGGSTKTVPLGTAGVVSLAVSGDDTVLALTNDGVLHAIGVDEDATLGEDETLSVVGGGAVRMTVAGDYALVEGTDGAVSVIDLKAHSVKRTVSTVDGSAHGPKPLTSVSAWGEGQAQRVWFLRAADDAIGWFDVSAGEAHQTPLPEGTGHMGSLHAVSDGVCGITEAGEVVRLSAPTATAVTLRGVQELATPVTDVAISASAADGTVPTWDATRDSDGLVRLTLTQEVPLDATSLSLWCELPACLELAEAPGDIVLATKDTLCAGATATLADGRLVVSIADKAVEVLRGATVHCSFRARVVDEADFEANGIASDDGEASVRLGVRVNDEERSSDATGTVLVAQSASGKDTPAPTVSTSVDGSSATRNETVTYTITQRVPDDATSVELWFELDDALEYTTTAESVRVSADGTALAAGAYRSTIDGKRLTVVLGELAQGAASNASGSNAASPEGRPRTDARDTSHGGTEVMPRDGGETETAEVSAQGSLVDDPVIGAADEKSASVATSVAGKTVTVVFAAKAKAGANLAAKVGAGGSIASIPCQAHVRFNGDPTREAVSASGSSGQPSETSSGAGATTQPITTPVLSNDTSSSASSDASSDTSSTSSPTTSSDASSGTTSSVTPYATQDTATGSSPIASVSPATPTVAPTAPTGDNTHSPVAIAMSAVGLTGAAGLLRVRKRWDRTGRRP